MKKLFMMGVALAALAASPLIAQPYNGNGNGNGRGNDRGMEEHHGNGCGLECDFGAGCGPSCASGCDTGGDWFCSDCDSCVDPCCPFGYARFHFGVLFVWDPENEHVAQPLTSEWSYDAGWVGVGAIGHQFDNGLAIELEAAFRRNLFDEIKYNGQKYKGAGDLEVWSAMLNGLYHFCLDSHYVPYIGVGIGFADVEVEILNLDISGSPFPLHDDTLRFAWQVLAGVNYEMCCGYDLQFEYRYFGTQDPRLFTRTGVKIHSELNTHSIGAGVRFRFN